MSDAPGPVPKNASAAPRSGEKDQIEQTTLEKICAGRDGVAPGTLEQVLTLAVELAREGREGKKVGTIFTVGDAEGVMERSRPLILDPLAGHASEAKLLTDPDMRETVKELAVLDGGFVVSNEGVVHSAARYFSASSEGVELPLGLGSRHMAAASLTLRTCAVAVVVSESSVVRLFDGGKIVSEIIPELWMLRRHSTELFQRSEAARQASGMSEGTSPAIVLENKEP